jgi:2,3-diketo-5-methylthio-1-phosphopentane phosphatase
MLGAPSSCNVCEERLESCAVRAPPLVLVLDFDGTMTRLDVGDEVCERFADPRWREIDAAWLRGELSLPEAQRQMWALCRASRAEAVRFAREVGALRPGLDALLDAVTAAGGEAWLASGGFDFYIEAILDAQRARFARAWYNRAHFDAGGIGVEFPHAEVACATCAVCKGRVVDAARAVARRVVFAGDGSSDRCVIGRGAEIFAVRGGRLAAGCEAAGAPYTPFDELFEVAAHLRAAG